jgi:hypothetical protein
VTPVDQQVEVLQRMWRLPARRPMTSAALALQADHRRLWRAGRCFVCLAPGQISVGFLGVYLCGTFEGPCYATLLNLGKDRTRSPRGCWLPKWDILRRLAARWPASA